MAESLSDKIASLRAVAPKLNASTSEAGDVVLEVEVLLDELGVGIPAEVPAHAPNQIVSTEDGRVEVSYRLAYGRIAGKYRIHVIERHYADSDGDGHYETLLGDEAPLAWGSCPRALKLQSFAALPALLDAITTEAQRLAASADLAVASVREGLGTVAARPIVTEESRRRFLEDPEYRKEVLALEAKEGAADPLLANALRRRRAQQ